MKIKKISVTTGTRAEYGLLRPILKRISESKKLELFLIVTGMHLSKKYGLSVKEIENDGFKISKKIKMLPNGDSSLLMTKSLGKGIVSFSDFFEKFKPDINLVLGDRDEALASVIAASHMNILNAHIHGGDKTKAGLDEYNRHAITKFSNIHFAASKKSFQRIVKLGENPNYVILSGSPGIDDIKSEKITPKRKLEKKLKIKFSGDEIILLYHPVTTQVSSSEKQIIKILKALKNVKKTTISILPNSDAGNYSIIKQLKLFSKKNSFFNLFPNLPRSDYLSLLKHSGILLGNSSSGVIEGSYFDIPVVNIGIRQTGRERSKNVIDVSENSTNEIQTSILTALKKKKNSKSKTPNIYGSGNSSQIIVKFLEDLKLTDELIQKQITY